MKYFLSTAIALWLMAGMTIAKKAPVAGDWLLTKVETSRGLREVYIPLSFQSDGNFIAMDRKMGTWNYNSKAKTVHIDSRQFKNMNGENDVLKLTKMEMVLSHAGNKMHFIRMDKDKISGENKSSGFLGTWKLSADHPETLRFITFSEPDDFTYVEKQPGMVSKSSGNWIFDKKNHTLIMMVMGRNKGFKGMNRVVSLDKDGFTLNNKGKTLKAVKAKTQTNIEHLTFSEKDFFDADGNFKYENDEQKLPWQDPSAMMAYLQNIHKLTYTYSVLVQGDNVFKNSLLSANVKVDEEGQRACIDFIFYGYDKEHLPEDTSLPPNCMRPDDLYNKLFPQKEMDFRVTGKEQITTPAGTFACTVVEAMGDREQRYKMWLVDDKPGVYAKIIEEKPDKNLGYYHLFTLKSIK